MKKVYWITVSAWGVYAFINHKELKPSDDYFLFLLCAVSMLLAVIGMIEALHENK